MKTFIIVTCLFEATALVAKKRAKESKEKFDPLAPDAEDIGDLVVNEEYPNGATAAQMRADVMAEEDREHSDEERLHQANFEKIREVENRRHEGAERGDYGGPTRPIEVIMAEHDDQAEAERAARSANGVPEVNFEPEVPEYRMEYLMGTNRPLRTPTEAEMREAGMNFPLNPESVRTRLGSPFGR